MPFSLDATLPFMRATLMFPPAVVGWNRLEGRPRTVGFERALRAEVRDALWFLTRQWQFGEFKGEDAGSPIEVRTGVQIDPLQHYAVDRSKARAFDASAPLEAIVEREAQAFDIVLHAQGTRYFWRLNAGLANQTLIRDAYRKRFPLAATAVEGAADDDARRAMLASAGRALDVPALLKAIADGTHDTFVAGIGSISAADRAALKTAAAKLSAWWAQHHSAPADNAWNARFLEYQFAIATDTADRGQTVLAANQYTQGHLEWFAFDVDASPGAHLTRGDGTSAVPTANQPKPLSFVPVPVSFGGMPSHRYWEMESRQIEFANIDANTTDVAKLLLTEFALDYANDWCVIPYELRTGTLATVVGMLVSDDFGEQSLLLPAGRGFDDRWQRWSMFTMSRTPSGGEADTRFLFAPTVGKLLEGTPLERVHFLRDEMANMVWAVEQTLASGFGEGVSGNELAARAMAASPPRPPMAPTTAPVRYVLGTDVPYNWIPFIPVHVPGSTRSVQLQRAQMPPTNPANPDERKPRTRVLSIKPPYYVNEEEVPRSGKIVTRSYQRGRWLKGQTVVWVGRRVTVGRGEGSSGLAFDQVVNLEKPRT